MLKNEYDEGTRIYFDRIKKFKPFTLKEEKTLFKSYKKGNLRSRDMLINSNLKFVVHVAKNYRNRGVSFDDLISEGNYGLLKSFEKYDFNKDNKLSSYAVHWIKFFIEDKIKKDKVVSDYTIDSTILNALEQKNNLVEEIKTDDDFDVIDEEFDYEKQNYYKNVVHDLLDKILNEREIEILKYSFGLDNCELLNLKEISLQLGISQERVRQIKEKAMMKLRSKCLEHNIELYL